MKVEKKIYKEEKAQINQEKQKQNRDECYG